MFCIIYRFEVKSGYEEQFIASWKGLTRFYREFASSLGSRLHRSTANEYIAYAQWPDETTYLNSRELSNTSSKEWSKQMKEACTKIERLPEITLVEDMLIH